MTTTTQIEGEVAEMDADAAVETAEAAGATADASVDNGAGNGAGAGGMTLGAAFNAYFLEPREVKEEEKPVVYPEVQRFVKWVREDTLVRDVIPSEVARFSETYRANASEDKKKLAQHVKNFLNYLKKKGYTTESLAPHIRVRPRANTGQRTTTSRRRQTEVQITQAGYDEMQQELERLGQETVRLADEITRAAASGDVRENAPLEAARENQGMVQAQIRRIESTLKSATIIDESERLASQEIQIGSFVKLVRTDDEVRMQYQIVSANEANPLISKISDISPVGSALIGKKIGDEINVMAPGGQRMYKIEDIS